MSACNYDYDVSRWLSRDPIGEQGGLNLYGFVNNDPIRLVDPRGNISWIVWAAIVVAAEATWDYYCYDKAVYEGANFGASLQTTHCDFDRHAHCYTTCSFNQCKLLLTPWITALYATIRDSIEHNDSWSEWWDHVTVRRAHGRLIRYAHSRIVPPRPQVRNGGEFASHPAAVSV